MKQISLDATEAKLVYEALLNVRVEFEEAQANDVSEVLWFESMEYLLSALEILEGKLGVVRTTVVYEEEDYDE